MREIAEIVAELACNACGNNKLVPVDAMRLYMAMQRLPIEELALLVSELTLDTHVVVPSLAPMDWNPVKAKAYGIFITHARAAISPPQVASA